MQKETKITIVIFLLATFALMFVSHGIIALLLEFGVVSFESMPVQILGIIGGGAPAFAALFIVYARYSKETQDAYWSWVFTFKVPYYWWLFIFLAPLLLGGVLHYINESSLAFIDLGIGDIIGIPIMFGAMIFAGGAEELGWRGILQKESEPSVPLAYIGIFIGIIWGLWHLPLFLIEGFAHYDYAFSIYILSTVIFSLWMTGVVYKTGSVGMAILMHAAVNTAANLGFNVPMERSPVIYTMLILVVIVSVVWLLRLEKRTI